MAKYFVRLNRATQGPFTLSELVQHDIRPTTYVWTKGMPQWQRAEDVPDICRAMRFVLAGLPIPGEPSDNGAILQHNNTGAQQQQQQDSPTPFGFRSFPEPPHNIDYNVKPKGVSIIMAVLLTICLFPLTGLITLWYACKFRYLWRSSEAEDISAADRHALRVKAYEKARMYRIMYFLTIFLTLIMIGLLMAFRS
ncbi:MAG: DUF4339 domain-containing protein [Muribaculaceae bacterium]|nr:DUF4339 domain-containing protein [Muribaculaceae bacterium]